jgi:MFS family permease
MTTARTLFSQYRSRTVLGLSLFIGQAFLYNAVFFTYVLVLTKFFKVAPDQAPLYIIPFAIGNFLGPLLLGRFFDTIGRKPMIAGTYIISGALLVVMGFLFKDGTLDETTLTASLCVIFFFASAGASAAYLTVSEVFPMETRALAIAFFYAIGTAIGGIIGPLLFGKLIEKGVDSVFYGYLLGAALMIAAGIVEIFLGVKAEGRALEDIAKPLTAEDAEKEEGEPARAPAAAPAASPAARRRRFGPGDQPQINSPMPSWSTRPSDEADLELEIDTLARMLEEKGELPRDELGDLVQCRYWGPGRYRRALSKAVERGRIRRTGRGRFAPAQRATTGV